MRNTPDLISICIPTYNGENYILEALNSIKNQSYKNIEVIISDDNSNDKTLEICEKFKSEVDFPVYIYNHLPNGIGSNWNNCILKSKGDYIQFLFQDDLLALDCLEKKISFIQKYNLVCTFSKREIIDENSQIIKSGSWYERFGDLQINTITLRDNEYILEKKHLKRLKSHFITDNIFGEPGTFLYKKNLFKEIGFFNENYKQILDAEYSYRILNKYPIGLIKEKLYYFRIHKSQASVTNMNDPKVETEYKIFEKYLYKTFFLYLPRKYQVKFFKNIFKF